MKIRNSVTRLALCLVLLPLAAAANADGGYVEARIVGKYINNDADFDYTPFSAGIAGDVGGGAGLSVRWPMGRYLYFVADAEAYKADYDIFITDLNERLLTVQDTASRTFSAGFGLAMPLSERVVLETELSLRKRTTDLQPIQLDLSSGNGSVTYDGRDISKSGLLWRFGIVTQISDSLEWFVSASGSNSGRMRVMADGVGLASDEQFGLGMRFSLSENIELGVSWQQSDEATGALSMRLNF